MSSRTPRGGGASLGFPPMARSAIIILSVNAALWVMSLVLFYASPDSLAMVQRLFYLDTNLVLDGYVHQLVTYMFFHDVGSPFHIIFNMLLVYFFAHALEDEWGLKKTLWFTFAAGLSGGVFVFLADLLWTGFNLGPTTVVLGFSGAALGQLAAYALLRPNQQILLMFIIPIKAKYIIPLTIAIDLLFWITPGNTTSLAAHLGGIAFAVLAMGGLWPEQLWLRFRYWRIQRELKKRKGKGDNVVQGPWIH